MAETAEVLAPKFEERYYHTLREELAPVIGSLGVEASLGADAEILEQRRRTEVVSTLAEGLKPDTKRSIINTRYPLDVVDGRIVAEDGEPLEAMLRRRLKLDEELAAKDTFFESFLVKQSQYDIDELGDWEAALNDETDYNTVITFSPYREEYDDGTPDSHHKLKLAGFKPHWRRGMFRVAHAHGGKLHVFNYSTDNNSVEIMRRVALEELGYEFNAEDSTGILGERIHLQINDDSWNFIAPRLVTRADNILGEEHGGVWRHGHDPDADVREAQAYVESQTQIVDWLIAKDKELALKHGSFADYEAEWLHHFYNSLALLEGRLEQGREDEPIEDYDSAAQGAGDIARADGVVYDACGLIIAPDSLDGRHISEATKTGFESLMRLENKKINCVNCKKSVVVDKKYLAKGELHCNECGYHLDVCTGKVTHRKAKKNNVDERPNSLQIISLELARHEAERRQKMARQKIANQLERAA